jgi:hypothetical protein
MIGAANLKHPPPSAHRQSSIMNSSSPRTVALGCWVETVAPIVSLTVQRPLRPTMIGTRLRQEGSSTVGESLGTSWAGLVGSRVAETICSAIG